MRSIWPAASTFECFELSRFRTQKWIRSSDLTLADVCAEAFHVLKIFRPRHCADPTLCLSGLHPELLQKPHSGSKSGYRPFV